MRKKVSIAVPCYNEEGNVKPMAEKLTEIMAQLNYDYEIIFTDNCSTDRTKQYLREIAKADPHIKVLMNNRNYGAGGRSGHNTGRYCSGDIYIQIPCDFQEPPELLPEFIKYWEEGYKVVAGQKIASKEGKVKYFLRSLFYRIINLFSDIPQYAHMSGILLTDREVLEEWVKTDDDIILRNAIADMGYPVKMIQYVQQERRSGKSSYNVWRYLTFALNSMINTSTTPLRIMTVSGLCMSVISFIIGVVYLIMKLTMWYNFPTGSAPTLIGMMFLGSVQLLFMGIIGEYVGVILRKVSNQPQVIVGEKLNFEKEGLKKGRMMKYSADTHFVRYKLDTYERERRDAVEKMLADPDNMSSKQEFFDRFADQDMQEDSILRENMDQALEQFASGMDQAGRARLIVDIFACTELYGIAPEEYFQFRFYWKNDQGRREYMGDKERFVVFRSCYNFEEYEKIRNKWLMYQQIGQFFNRKCLLISGGGKMRQ